MSPKAGGGAGGLGLRSRAWTRDVGPDTSGITYSRRPYCYYDREFSDSIICYESSATTTAAAAAGWRTWSSWAEPVDDSPPAYRLESQSQPRVAGGQRSPPGGGCARSASKSYAFLEEEKEGEKKKKEEDPFTRGRVLQCASDNRDDNHNHVIATAAVAAVAADPTTDYHRLNADRSPAQARPGAPHHAPPHAAPADPAAPGLTAPAGLDARTAAQGVVVVADILVRLTEAYRRIRDGEGAGDDELPGARADPYHLEAGPSPSRRLPPAAKAPGTYAPRVVVEEVGVGGERPEHATAAWTGSMSSSPRLPVGKRICYYLLATVVLGVAASFGLALWWARGRGDASAGFTIGGYLVAVDALVVAVAGVVHRPGCRCWKA